MVLCQRCGASVASDSEHEHEDEDDRSDQPVARSQTSQRTGTSRRRSERRPRTRPADLRVNAQCLVVRRAVLCQVPGINRVRAEAIVRRYPTISALMAASVGELEAVPIKRSSLGRELAVALKRVFE